MPTTREVEALIIESVRLLAEDFDIEGLKQAGKETSLYGNEGSLDSMGLVNLIADVEDAIHSKYDLSVALVDEKAVSSRNSPFLNVGTLTRAVMERLPQ